MHAVVGIDTGAQAQDAVAMVANLWPRNLAVSLVHAISPAVPAGSTMFEGALYAVPEIQEGLEKAGWSALGEAKERLPLDADIDSHLEFGAPVSRLLHAAEEKKSDLIAVGAAPKDALSLLFLGSTSRGILGASPVSVLVVKRPPLHAKSMVAVLAIDHSEYGAKCLEEFIRLAPVGLRRIVVLTANEFDFSKAAVVIHDVPAVADKAKEWISDELRQANQKICDRLTGLGFSCEVAVKEMSANDAIHSAMEEHHADLLIVGAQGHGFFHRFLLGSVSFHQVAAEKHSVLVIRPREHTP